jgi:transposase-like protein
MPRYSEEHKAAVLSKLLPPQNRSVVAVSAEEGISNVTLYSWLKKCRQQGVPVPGQRNNGEDWTAEAKLAVVIETAPLSEAEVSAYCRKKGLYAEQIQRWKEACLHGANGQQDRQKAVQKQQKETRKTIKRLQAEIQRKDRALAETAALLVLSKKLEALYATDQDNEDS